MASICPFTRDAACPPDSSQSRQDQAPEARTFESTAVSTKCPFGYDSKTFKLGPLSCLICQALLYECSRCVPCAHVYCKPCISRLKDCLLCGADIESIEDDEILQSKVDQFIEGHGRIKRRQFDSASADVTVSGDDILIYEDVSIRRGEFLVQQAIRAFRANNYGSAKSRLSLCAEDIRAQLEEVGNTSELCTQLGIVLGLLGDCCRALGDLGAAIRYFDESVSFTQMFPSDDLEIARTHSISLNKIGDLKYHDGDLEGAKYYYIQSLNIRRKAVECGSNAASLCLDFAIALAKVGDVDRNLGNEGLAVDEFKESISILESSTFCSEEGHLDLKRKSVLAFLKNQLEESGNALAGS